MDMFIQSRRCIVMSATSLLCLVFSSPPIAGANEPVDVEKLIAASPVAYRFADHLSEAETGIDLSGKSVVGAWKDGRFIFASQGEGAEIRVVKTKIDDTSESGILISFYPRKKMTRWIRFQHVPAGQKMALRYSYIAERAAAPDEPEPAAASEPAFVSLRIWTGRHELRRIQVTNGKSWKKAQIDLGVASFLKRDIPVTFELTADSAEPSQIVFGAEILK